MLAAAIERAVEAVAYSQVVLTNEVEGLRSVNVGAVVVTLGVLEVAEALTDELAAKRIRRGGTFRIVHRGTAGISLDPVYDNVGIWIRGSVLQIVMPPRPGTVQ